MLTEKSNAQNSRMKNNNFLLGNVFFNIALYHYIRSCVIHICICVIRVCVYICTHSHIHGIENNIKLLG